MIFFALNLILIKSCSIQFLKYIITESPKSPKNHRNQLKIKTQKTDSGIGQLTLNKYFTNLSLLVSLFRS